VDRRPRRVDRQPGRAADPRRAPGHLPIRVAGRGRREPLRQHLPGPVALPGELGALGRAADQQRPHARRSDRVHGNRRHLHRLDGADRRRRGSRLRWPAQRLRTHAVDDPGRGCWRALGGPARQREEVRPHGRQGARPDAAAHPHAQRRPPRGRRGGCAVDHHRAHGRSRGHSADERRG